MKTAIVYSSTTGNTEAMANAIYEAASTNGAEIVFGTPESVDLDAAISCDVLLLGSPAMGDEVLEDSMEDFFAKIEGDISNKKVGLFGSYDWGDGQWLRTWQERANAAGATTFENLMVHLTPNEEDLEHCKNWAKSAL